MNHKEIVKLCKELGCCDTCCLRYIGLKSPSSYEDVHQFILKYLDTSSQSQNSEENQKENKVLECNSTIENTEQPPIGSTQDEEENTSASPSAKRVKLDNVCVSCLGVLQEETWPEGFSMVQDLLDEKCYECDSIAVALSSPVAAMLRERAITLQLEEVFPGYEHRSLMPLKEAWKWTFGRRLAARVGKLLDSGAVAPLLVTLSLEYDREAQELEALKKLAPAQFEARGRQPQRFAVQYTRRAAEQALAGAALAAVRAAGDMLARPPRAARPARAQAAHAPAYLGGRYVKLSRALPQTPWLVAGRRMLQSSVQEIIFAPVAAAYGLNAEEAERRLKFMSAGREDVDVRCLGTGRPFALEVADPRRQPSAAELQRACEQIGASGQVRVQTLVPVSREDLVTLKQGEETKCKTYEALCVKLEHTAEDRAEAGGAGAAVRVTARDVAALNAYCSGGVALRQRTPLRVLHRRPLLARARRVLALAARAVPGRPALLALRVRTSAGTYVKEWAHGELRRTRPALRDALGARADIVALDVRDVELAWPPAQAQ